MPSETPFRVTLLIVFVLTTTITLRYRIKAASSGEKISRREEGFAFAVVLRVAGASLFLFASTYLAAPSLIQWAAVDLPTWLRWGGGALGIGCSILMAWTLSSLGKNLTDTVVTRSDATLVTRGPYRWVRHPFYVVTALLTLSATLVTANLMIGVSSLIVLGLLAVRTPKEERMLIDKFGDRYRDYMANTGRYIPKFWR